VRGSGRNRQEKKATAKQNVKRKKERKKLNPDPQLSLQNSLVLKTVIGMMACAAAGAVVLSKSAGAMLSKNEALPADEGLLSNKSRRAVEKVDVSSKKTTTTMATGSPSPPPSDAASPPS